MMLISADAETVTGGATESVGFAGGSADSVECAGGATEWWAKCVGGAGSGVGSGAGASNTEGVPKSCTLVVTTGSLG